MTKMQKDLHVHISDNAILHLLMSGLECFMVRKWGGEETIERGGTETAGTLWGYFKQGSGNDLDHVRIEHISQDAMADRHASWVTHSYNTAWVKHRIVQARWPHLALIGDFHTHPYRSYKKCENDEGWNFSEDDYKSIQGKWLADELKVWRNFKVSLVLTIAQLQKVYEKTRWLPELIADHIVRFQIGDFRFWISVYAVDRVSDQSTFVVSPGFKGCRQRVFVDAPTINGTEAWFENEELLPITKG